MPPRLNLFRVVRPLVIQPRPQFLPVRQLIVNAAPFRGYASTKDEKPATGPNQDVLPHVSEEAIEMGEVMGETTPDISQGTPVQEILERDEESRKKAPQVIKEEMGNNKNAAETTTFANLLALGQMEAIAGGRGNGVETPGHKFGLPSLPLPSTSNLKHRYDPVVEQFTKLIMRHGKLGQAQRNMSIILNQLRTASVPTLNPARPLLPGSPPPSHLPLNPILYLTLAVDSIAPLLRIRSQKGAAGGGSALQIPVPLGLRQRRRTAVQWILDAVNKKKSRGSGKEQFAQKVADEIISVVEGKSAAWDRRGLIHKTATAARANLTYYSRRR